MTSKLALIALLLGLILAAAPVAFSQTGGVPNTGQTPTDSSGNALEDGLKGFWECVTPTGRFVVRLDHITSVSQHQYLIDGGARVYEVTVDTSGPMTARFYFIEPITENSPLSMGKATIDRLREVAGEVGQKVGVDTEREVTKHYPDTTHAKTAEYRLQVKDNLDRIYEHIHRVWAQERGAGQKNKITIRDE
ncbi:MAG: hypothetical protein JNK37_13210 [Verrucomicrobiales bacterium]|nr:hypothetical protein [Verrucomicrobiales bacterium]